MKGQKIISMSTNNPNVPGNAAAVATLAAAQTALEEAAQAADTARETAKQKTAARDTAMAMWVAAANGLAAFTENATGGNADKILTTGYDVKSDPTPPVPVGQIMGVRVSFTGKPGYSKVEWNNDRNADAFVVERSPDPITATSWENQGTVAEAKYEGNGAIPGKMYWYRVAGVNRLGQGPWSEPALRPVM